MQMSVLTTNQKVGGSSPFRRTKVSQKWETFFCFDREIAPGGSVCYTETNINPCPKRIQGTRAVYRA